MAIVVRSSPTLTNHVTKSLQAIGQLCSTASMAHNLSQCQTLVKNAVKAGAKVHFLSSLPLNISILFSLQALFLPEATDYIASSPSESVSLAVPMATSPFLIGLQSAAKQNNLAINVGIHVPTTNGKILNRSCWIREDGELEAWYDKLHLFDHGDLKESRSVQAGNEIVKPVETAVGRVGLMICFDVSLDFRVYLL